MGKKERAEPARSGFFGVSIARIIVIVFDDATAAYLPSLMHGRAPIVSPSSSPEQPSLTPSTLLSLSHWRGQATVLTSASLPPRLSGPRLCGQPVGRSVGYLWSELRQKLGGVVAVVGASTASLLPFCAGGEVNIVAEMGRKRERRRRRRPTKISNPERGGE